MNMKNVFFANSLDNENIQVLGFKIIDALDKELALQTKGLEEEETSLSYDD